MTLAFRLEIEGKPTYFPEKILNSIKFIPVDDNVRRFVHSEYFLAAELLIGPPKIHTIREDKKDRWKEGKLIHFVINNRTKNRLQFAPAMPVLSIQFLEIKYTRDTNKTIAAVFIDHIKIGEAIWINCSLKNSSFTVGLLAKNDGFDSINEFFEWFSEDFKGKIIHWTNYKYHA